MVKLVRKEQSSNFLRIYYNASVRYNHKIVWAWMRVTCEKTKKRRREEVEGQLLKPLSRFYHFLNIASLLVIWLFVEFFMAFYHHFIERSDSIPVWMMLVAVLFSATLGNITILTLIKLFYYLYVKNIETAFEEAKKLLPPIFVPKVKSKEQAPLI